MSSWYNNGNSICIFSCVFLCLVIQYFEVLGYVINLIKLCIFTKLVLVGKPAGYWNDTILAEHIQ